MRAAHPLNSDRESKKLTAKIFIARVPQKSGVTTKVRRHPSATQPLYARNVWSLTVSSTNKKTLAEAKKQRHLWWRHPFYRTSWDQWRVNWQKLADRVQANIENGPAGVLRSLKDAHCDPDVALRLAFLEASHKPATQSELVKDNARQQYLRRKLSQSRGHLRKALVALAQLTPCNFQKGNKKKRRINRKPDEYRNHVLKAARELERALSDIPLIFISRADILSLRTMSDAVKPENVTALKSLVDMCTHEGETLLWPRAVELAPGHELFTLVSYVKACSGGPNFPLVTDLLNFVYAAHGQRSASREAIEKQVERFAKLNSIQPALIEDSTRQRANSGELRQELLACYPDQSPA